MNFLFNRRILNHLILELNYYLKYVILCFKNIIFNLINNYSMFRILKRVKVCVTLKRKKRNEEVSEQLMRVDVWEREAELAGVS